MLLSTETAKDILDQSSAQERVLASYEQSLAWHCDRAALCPLVDGKIGLHGGVVPVLAKSQEPLSIVLGEILCAKSLDAVTQEIQESTGISPDELHAALEFVCAILTPGAA